MMRRRGRLRARRYHLATIRRGRCGGHRADWARTGIKLSALQKGAAAVVERSSRAAITTRAWPSARCSTLSITARPICLTRTSGKPQQPGAAIYLGMCAACHGTDGKGQAPFMPPLAGNPAVLDANPSSLINLVLNGADPLVVKGVPDAYRMPQFRIQLNDEAIGEVLSFVREAWGNGAAAVTAEEVGKLRPVTDPSSDRGRAEIEERRPVEAIKAAASPMDISARSAPDRRETFGRPYVAPPGVPAERVAGAARGVYGDFRRCGVPHRGGATRFRRAAHLEARDDGHDRGDGANPEADHRARGRPHAAVRRQVSSRNSRFEET
jgi:mono/diheme cytochrome c family protein